MISLGSVLGELPDIGVVAPAPAPAPPLTSIIEILRDREQHEEISGHIIRRDMWGYPHLIPKEQKQQQQSAPPAVFGATERWVESFLNRVEVVDYLPPGVVMAGVWRKSNGDWDGVFVIREDS